MPNANKSTDECLAQAARDGDPEAFEALARRLERRVYGLCRLVLQNDHEAADATQEAFLRSYDRLASYDPARPFAPWLLTIAARVSRDLAGRRRPRPSATAPVELAAPAADPALVLSDREDLERIRRAIGRLPERERLALVLRFEEGLEPREAADAVGVSEGNLRVILYRAKARLRSMLRESL